MSRKSYAFGITIVLFFFICSASSLFAYDLDSAVSDLYGKMEDAAKEVARGAHPLSSVEDVELTGSRIVEKGSKAADVYAEYVVHMKGAILGKNWFEVGVKVSGAVKMNGKDWKVWVKGKHKTHDIKKH